MKKTMLLAIGLTLLLAGCARGRLGDGLNGYTDLLVQRPNPLLPNIFVDKSDGKEYLILDQEPIRIPKDQNVTISWALQAGSEYKFKGLTSITPDCVGAPNAELAQRLNCSLAGDGKTLQCPFPARFVGSNSKTGKVCYSLTVINGAGQDIKTDPSIVSD